MPSALIIPGVQVTTQFEPAPVLPGATGILGVVGVAERGPLDPTSIGSLAELVDQFGAATRYSMPEILAAFASGVARVFVARTQPGRGQKATLDLPDDDGEKTITLTARAEGRWGNALSVQVAQLKTLSGRGIKYVNLDVFLDGQPIESFRNLVMDETSPDYFFDRVNGQSRVLVAVDTLFQTALPAAIGPTALADSAARAASAILQAGGAAAVRVEAKLAGRRGNASAVRVLDGRAGLALTGAGNAPSLEVRARVPGAAGTGFRASVSLAGPGTFNLTITPAAGAPRVYGPFATTDDAVAGLKEDPDVLVEKRGVVPPAAVAATPLSRRVTIEVITEGADTNQYPNLPTIDAIAAIADPIVTFSAVGGGATLPDALPDGARLTGGRDKGPSLSLKGDTGDDPLLEIVPAPGAPGDLSVRIARGISTIDGATGVVNLGVLVGGQEVETFANATMDPDDVNYLPAVLQSSALVRAHDLFVRTRTFSFPANMSRPTPLAGGASPLIDDFQSALDRLESAEEVDLVLASAPRQLDDAGVRAAHRAVAAHCAKMADVARNRIGLGSVTAAESASVAAILDHADDVRSDYFILCTPSGTEAAVAGLLSLLNYFESPTFKAVPGLDVPPGRYTDSQLIQLIENDVVAVNEKRRLGSIVVKGLLTSGRQINVQRTANKAVRDVRAIGDVYVGLLNNDGTRNALRQQIIALFLQMERDGAIVPSTDGKDPSHRVDVYSTEADFANGIVRVDIAIRPVRSIDYIYASILVKN